MIDFCFNFFRVLGVAGLLVGASNIQAQGLVLQPLEKNTTLQKMKQERNGARSRTTCPSVILSLPFFEDFSSTEGIYPSCEKWEENLVFINNTMADNPPSIGVATFDGLDANGEPYNQGASVTAGTPADTLTSHLFDLSTASQNSELKLSYYLQAQGLGDRPSIQDSIVVEFRDSLGEWDLMKSYQGVGNSVSSFVVPEFIFDFIALDSIEYFHDSFQFRFINYASVTGNNDHWHLDYVYFDSSRSSVDTTQLKLSNDVTFIKVPTRPLERYSAMPWRQVDTSVWKDSLEMFTRNLSLSSGTLDRLYTIETEGGVNLMTNPIPVINYVPSLAIGGDTGRFVLNNTIAWLPQAKDTLVTCQQIIDPTSFQGVASYFYNDTVCSKTELDNYYAYDDGTAETRVIAQGIGTQVAMEFKTTIADTLRGVYIHMPYYRSRNSENDFINVKVWLDTLDNEVFSIDFKKLRYVKGHNGFYFVEFTDFTGTPEPIALEAGQRFYVGWQQASFNEVPIGFDRSTNAAQYTYLNVGSTWSKIDLKGAVMLRPLVTMDFNYQPTVAVKNVPSLAISPLKLFPNPVNGTLNLDYENPEYCTLKVSSVLGETVYRGDWKSTLDCRNWQTGIYWVQLFDAQGSLLTTQKIIKK